MTLSTLTHRDRISLYCTGALTELQRANRATYTATLTPAGLALWEQLAASGFRPSYQEALEWIALGCPEIPVAVAVGCPWETNPWVFALTFEVTPC